MGSIFIKKKNADVFYVIHRNTLTNGHVETLPFVFITKQQANRYLTNMLDVFIGTEKSKYIDSVKYIYKVQRVSLLDEHKTMTKKEFESLQNKKSLQL